MSGLPRPRSTTAPRRALDHARRGAPPLVVVDAGRRAGRLISLDALDERARGDGSDRRRPGHPGLRPGRATASRENRTFCWDWVQRQLGRRSSGRALVEHIQLTAIAVAIGFAIASRARSSRTAPAGSRRRSASSRRCSTRSRASRSSSCSSPITGLTRDDGRDRARLYTLLILFRNILAGLRSVPAGRARGRTRDGPDAAARRSGGSSCRSRCPRSSPGSGSRR